MVEQKRFRSGNRFLPWLGNECCRCISSANGDVYKSQELGDILLERLVEYILRNYPGIFVQYAYIDEEILAGKLGVKRQQVYESLLLLARRRIIGYIPGNDRPYIVYHQPRVPAHYLHIGPEAYEDRKQAYAVKVGHMAGYIELTDSCRQLYLMAYLDVYKRQPRHSFPLQSHYLLYRTNGCFDA